ncbi:unnamed protein product [Cylindrotheca closterium]|uniref:Uncharacterized protein n=1 Tax=Cylindrotheca closterium TaxID=2856 RepID=A0AAD2FXZ4_9STRA|nr:unnamed protein product [Cylindrotheca closterium]
MAGIKALKKAIRATQHDPPGVTKQTMDQGDGLSKRKKKKNAAKKLKAFWEKKKQQQKNLSPNADEVSLKDAAMQLPTGKTRHQTAGKPSDVLSPRTAPESVDSPLHRLPVLPNPNHPEHYTAEQIFRRQQEAPGTKGMEIMEVVVPSDYDAQIGNISPISMDNSAFYPQSRSLRQQSGVPGRFDPPTTHYTEGLGVELALQLPSLQQRTRRGGGIVSEDLASETESSTRGRSRERARSVSAFSRRRIRPNSGDRTRHDDEPQEVDPIFSTAIDLTDVENEEQAMKLVLRLNGPANAFDNISNPLTAVPNVFGSLTDLLKDPPVAGEEDDRSEVIGSFKADSSKGEVDERDERVKRETVDVMKKESTKGAPFDPIDLTECDFRLLVRKPAEAINVGFVEDADDAYDEMIQTSHSIVTKATHRMLGRNNTWYLG